MKKEFTVTVTKVSNGMIVDAKVDQTDFYGITNQYGLTAIGFSYKNYIQHLLDKGFVMQVIKQI